MAGDANGAMPYDHRSMTCPLCQAKSPRYALNLNCCRVRLILGQPSREHRATWLHVLSERFGAEAAAETAASVEAVFASRRETRQNPISSDPSSLRSLLTHGLPGGNG